MVGKRVGGGGGVVYPSGEGRREDGGACPSFGFPTGVQGTEDPPGTVWGALRVALIRRWTSV